MLRQDDLQKSLIVVEAWKQGLDYGGHSAACMIASCLANRVRAGWGNWLETVYRIPQFSALNVQPHRDLIPEIWHPNVVRLLHEIEAIYDGSADHAKGAMYWADLRYIETPFFKDKILGNLAAHPRCCDLNTLTFFR